MAWSGFNTEESDQELSYVCFECARYLSVPWRFRDKHDYKCPHCGCPRNYGAHYPRKEYGPRLPPKRWVGGQEYGPRQSRKKWGAQHRWASNKCGVACGTPDRMSCPEGGVLLQQQKTRREEEWKSRHGVCACWTEKKRSSRGALPRCPVPLDCN
eukprot:g13825.t1